MRNSQQQCQKKREEIHTEVDNAIDQIEKEIDKIKVKHHSILQKHLDEIKQLQALMQQTLKALIEMEESNEVATTINCSCKIEEFAELTPKVRVSMPKFIPNQINKEVFCSLIGKLTPLSTTLEESVLSAKTPKASVRELLDEPEIISTIKTGDKYVRSVTYFNEEQIWTSGGTADIKCFNNQGVLQETLKKKSRNWPNDIHLAVDRDGVLLYSDYRTRTVYKVKKDQTEKIITLQGWSLANLCVTSFGDLLVTMFNDGKTQSKVVRYSGSTVKQTIQFDDKGQPLYSGNAYMKYIDENRNLDICLADHGVGAVVVVNQAGKLRFRYTGHPPPTKYNTFKPFGITTDSQSRILISDFNRIHILNADGQFLRYIDNCDLEDPWALCVDSGDSLFVSEYFEGNVKKIRYSK